MTIHQEGRRFLFIVFLVLIALNAGIDYFFTDHNVFILTAGISTIFFILILQFFRNPKIITTLDDKHVIAPADGKVVVIEKVKEEEYFNEIMLQISIFMSPVNVHVNRTPVSGMVKFFKYHEGRYLVAWHPKSSSENERTTMVLQMRSGLEIMVRQIAGALARRIRWYVEEGDEILQGREFGFIKFGSRVDILIPIDSKTKVNVGDKVKAGKTVIAELPVLF